LDPHAGILIFRSSINSA